jgi:hypothetical protein
MKAFPEVPVFRRRILSLWGDAESIDYYDPIEICKRSNICEKWNIEQRRILAIKALQAKYSTPSPISSYKKLNWNWDWD